MIGSNPLDTRRAFIAFGLASMLPGAGAESPGPTRLVCPFPPGGSTDHVARLLARAMTESGRRNLVVENIPGAGSAIGAAAVAQGAPDGQRVLLATSGLFGILPVLNAGKLPLDPRRDLAIVAILATQPLVLAVRADFGHEASLRHLLSQARPLTYASGGFGTAGHIAGALLSRSANLDMTHVPYKGVGPAITDLLSGQVDTAFVDYHSVAGHLRDGRLKALGLSSAERLDVLPSTRTLAEQGLAGFDVKLWLGLAVSSATPPGLVRDMNLAFRALVDERGFRNQVTDAGLTPVSMDVEASRRFVERDVERWEQLLDRLKLRP